MSLAIAAHSLSEALESVLKPVHVVVDTPSATAEMVKSNTDNDFLNVFLYRVAPSTVHAAQTSNQPFFLRIFALLTPFARKDVATTGNGDDGTVTDGASGPADYPDLQILSDVIRHFHENPVSDIMNTQTDASGTAYRIHAIPQAPEMEELNHIWTTQNSALGYRLSAAFEFSLIAVDPLTLAPPAPPVRTAIAQIEPSLARKGETPTEYDLEFSAYPGLRGDDRETWDGPAVLPQALIERDGALLAAVEIAETATVVSLRLAGSTDHKALLSTAYFNEEGQLLNTTKAQHTVATVSLADPAGTIDHPLTLPTQTKTIVIEVRAGTATGANLALDRVGNTVTLTVAEDP